MIFALITSGLIIIGSVLLIAKNNRKFKYYTREVIELIGAIILTLGIFASLFVCGFLIAEKITHDVTYQNMLHKKEMLEYRIEHMEKNITGNEMLYNDIVEFNNELRSTKKYADSPWTNWFNNQDVASIDYIEIDGQ